MLRGGKVLELVLGDVRTYVDEDMRNSTLPRVVLPLRGRFKGETEETFHFVVVTRESNSGLEI